MTTLLTNAYSAKNLGDGLLVNESISIAKEAGLDPAYLLALDPESFMNMDIKILHSDFNKYKFLTQLYKGNLGMDSSTISHALAVGGGYLRFPTRKVAAKAYLSHLLQFKALEKNKIPYGLLPVSIGPINYFNREVVRVLSGAKFIAVRDDKSLNELGMLSNVVRIPDLSILHKFTRNLISDSDFQIGLIIRELGYKNWKENAKVLAEIPQSFMMLQSSVGSNNNDALYLKSIFPNKEILTTTEAFQIRRPKIVISSRLHGAIMSINQGVPAIHLGYERKSLGVFEDLGLSEFCIPADEINFTKLYELINRFKTNPSYFEYYFDCIEKTNESRLSSRQKLISLIAGLK